MLYPAELLARNNIFTYLHHCAGPRMISLECPSWTPTSARRWEDWGRFSGQLPAAFKSLSARRIGRSSFDTAVEDRHHRELAGARGHVT